MIGTDGESANLYCQRDLMIWFQVYNNNNNNNDGGVSFVIFWYEKICGMCIT